jgi:hypothetical protein
VNYNRVAGNSNLEREGLRLTELGRAVLSALLANEQ